MTYYIFQLHFYYHNVSPYTAAHIWLQYTPHIRPGAQITWIASICVTYHESILQRKKQFQVVRGLWSKQRGRRVSLVIDQVVWIMTYNIILVDWVWLCILMFRVSDCVAEVCDTVTPVWCGECLWLLPSMNPAVQTKPCNTQMHVKSTIASWYSWWTRLLFEAVADTGFLDGGGGGFLI